MTAELHSKHRFIPLLQSWRAIRPREGIGWCVWRDMCESFCGIWGFCITVYMMNMLCSSHLYLTEYLWGGTVSRFGPTRTRGISFDCFIVVPVFPPHAVASHLSVLPHTVNPLQKHTSAQEKGHTCCHHTRTHSCILPALHWPSLSKHTIGFVRLTSMEQLGFRSFECTMKENLQMLETCWRSSRQLIAFIFIFRSLRWSWWSQGITAQAGTILKSIFAGAFKDPRASEMWKPAAKKHLIHELFHEKIKLEAKR